MPRETIRSVHDNLALDVRWGEHGVQVATVNTDLIDSDTGVHRPDAGWHAEMDRAALNKAIRALRRARDAAFGPDA